MPTPKIPDEIRESHCRKEQPMNKQIKEMAKMLCIVMEGDCDYCRFDDRPSCPPRRKAEQIYNAGYRKQSEGEWTKYGTIFKCTNCDKTRAKTSAFCPNCGAKMKGGEE